MNFDVLGKKVVTSLFKSGRKSFKIRPQELKIVFGHTDACIAGGQTDVEVEIVI